MPDRNLTPDLSAKRARLLALIRSYDSCVVAFSAGVDSTVVAKAAHLALGDRAVAVTGVSPSLPQGELDEARRMAALIGIRHEVIPTAEFSNENYLRNDTDRCYHCKTDLYLQIEKLAPRFNVNVVLNGANRDDLTDYRPGNQAATEHRVCSPLAECGIRKDEVRALAADWELPIWDKPAMPCLSSRVAYGEEITPERLAMIDQAERFLREQGLRTVRVRYHKGDLARLEVPPDEIGPLCQPERRRQLTVRFKELGFRFVTIDLEGFRSGSLNVLVPAEVLAAQARSS
jgi:pyridinium-3,5-biscarboxylic acid mononucleotide sulfurtransferase